MRSDYFIPHHLWFVLISQACIASAAAVWAIQGDWLSFGVGVVSLLLSAVPPLVIRSPSLRILISVVTAQLLAAHVIFGMWFRLYELSALYDKVMHVVGSGAIAVIVYAALGAYCTGRSLTLPTVLRVALVFSVTLSLGVFWEVFEFGVDRTGLFYAQRGLTDTMIDLIADALGAAIAILIVVAGRDVGALYVHVK